MGSDVLSAVVTNSENSGVYLVVVPDSDGSRKSVPGIIFPGQSSDMHYGSIDALAAYSMKDGKPVDLQLLRVNLGLGDREAETAHWWKYPDGCHGTVKFQNGKAVLDMDAYVPSKGPVPSSQREWGIDNVPKPEPISQRQQDTAVNDRLMAFLNQHYGPEDAARVKGAVNERIAAYQLQIAKDSHEI